MSKGWVRVGTGALLACLLAACTREDPSPRDAEGSGAAIRARIEPPSADSGPRRAPGGRVLLASCPHPGLDRDAVLADFRSGAFEKLDAALAQRLTEHLANPSCEPYLAEFVLPIEEARERELVERWIAERPDSWAAYSLRASYWLAEPNANLAGVEADLQRAIELEPRSLVPYYYYVVLMEKTGRKSEVRPLLDRLLALDPFDFVVRERAIVALWPRAGESADAVVEIAKSAEPLAKTHPRLFYMMGFAAAARGDIAQAQGRTDEAIASYREAIGYGDHVGWSDALCNALYMRGDARGVVEAADQWLAWNPESAHALMWRGMAGVRIDRERGNRDIDRAVELDPNCAWVHAMRGFMRQVSSPEAALADLLRARELNPDEFAAIPPLARIYFHSDRLAEAEPLLRRWIATKPEDSEVWFYLGATLLMQGNGEGRPLLEQFVRGMSGNTQGWIAQNVAFSRQLLAAAPPAPAQEQRGAALPGLARLGLEAKP